MKMNRNHYRDILDTLLDASCCLHSAITQTMSHSASVESISISWKGACSLNHWWYVYRVWRFPGGKLSSRARAGGSHTYIRNAFFRGISCVIYHVVSTNNRSGLSVSTKFIPMHDFFFIWCQVKVWRFSTGGIDRMKCLGPKVSGVSMPTPDGHPGFLWPWGTWA